MGQDGGSGAIDGLLRWYYRPVQFPGAAAIVASMAAEYVEMHPNATINLAPDFPETGTPGHEGWLDSYYDVGMSISRAPDGHHCQVSLDSVESAMFCDVRMFEEAGVDAVGTFFAGSGWSNWTWADSVFLSAVWADMAAEVQMDTFYDADATLGFPGWRILNTEAIAKGIIDGKLDATDARIDTFLRISRESSEILPIDCIGGMTSLDDLMRRWLSEEMAVVWAGAPGTTCSAGGPSAAGQYGIPNSTAEAGNLELAVDWLMWMSAPQNFGPVANETAGFVTTVAGARPSPLLQGYEPIIALPDRMFTDPNGRLTAEHGDEWCP